MGHQMSSPQDHDGSWTIVMLSTARVQRNKTDRADALGIARIMRTGWFRRAHQDRAMPTGCGCC